MRLRELMRVRTWLWYVVVSTIGIGLIFPSIVSDLLIERHQHFENQKQFRQILVDTIKTDKPSLEGSEGAEESFLNECLAILCANGWDTVWRLTRDIGIALIVSVLVVLMIEQSNHRVLEGEFEERLEKVATGTIGATCGNDHPQNVFETVRRTVFDQPLLRERFNVVITLWPLDPSNRALGKEARKAIEELTEIAPQLGIDPGKLLAFQAQFNYRIRNVSSKPRKFDPPFGMERYFPATKVETCRVESVRVGDKEVRDKCQMTPIDKSPNILIFKLPPDADLEPQAYRDIAFSGFAIRYAHDDETLCSNLLTNGMSAELKDYTGLDLDLTIQSLFSGSQPETNGDGDTRTNTVKLPFDGCVLPAQSFVLSWSMPFRRSAQPAKPPKQRAEGRTATEAAAAEGVPQEDQKAGDTVLPV